MSSSFDKYQKRRLISSYFSVILSIGLVLFFVRPIGYAGAKCKKKYPIILKNR